MKTNEQFQTKPTKIFLVQSEWADGVSYEITQKAFSTYEKAKLYFDELAADARENDPLVAQEGAEIEESENEFEIFVDGFYGRSHFTISIIPMDVDKD